MSVRILTSDTLKKGVAFGLAGVGGTYGNSFPMFGTGNVFYRPRGCLLPVRMSGTGRLLPYANWMHA